MKRKEKIEKAIRLLDKVLWSKREILNSHGGISRFESPDYPELMEIRKALED